jgi:hypothetical protein
MPYYTHHKGMAAPHYVSAYDSSDQKMPYDTHHKRIADLQCASANVVSDEVSEQIFYCIHDRKMATHHYVSVDV